MIGSVVRLPTAAKRQPPRATTKAQRAAKAALPVHPAEYLAPWQREALKDAAKINGIGRSATLILASSIIHAMDDQQKMKVQIYCTLQAGTEEGQQAIAWLRLLTGSAGQNIGIHWALRQLNREAE